MCFILSGAFPVRHHLEKIDVCMVSGFLAQHPGQLVVLRAARRMDGRAGGRRGRGRTSAGDK